MNNPTIKYGDVKKNLIDFLENTDYSKLFILVDENTKKFCLPLLSNIEYSLIEIKSGEQHKNLDACQIIWNQLLNSEADRQSILINLGGGVISDMGGFCASTFKRGIRFVNIPTTLLSMVDATIGGKTGIDFLNQKNMIGLFQSPSGIIVDPIFLKTLDARQIKSGKAEMLKHGLIASEKHFNAVVHSREINLKLIKDSIAIKEQIVLKDPFEQGIRKSLNFGHTLGHALESLYLSQGKSLLHGEAVAQGMIWETKLSVCYSGLNQERALILINYIQTIFQEIAVSSNDIQHILSLVQNDKKNYSGKLRFPLLRDIGNVQLDTELNKEQIQAIF